MNSGYADVADWPITYIVIHALMVWPFPPSLAEGKWGSDANRICRKQPVPDGSNRAVAAIMGAALTGIGVQFDAPPASIPACSATGKWVWGHYYLPSGDGVSTQVVLGLFCGMDNTI